MDPRLEGVDNLAKIYVGQQEDLSAFKNSAT